MKTSMAKDHKRQKNKKLFFPRLFGTFYADKLIFISNMYQWVASKII
jgi:hypothetical protein